MAKACGILVPQPGIKPVPPALGAQSLNFQTDREVPQIAIIFPLVAQTVENSPAMQGTWVPFRGWEDPLEKGMATHSSILDWRIPKDRGAWKATVHEVAKSGTWMKQQKTRTGLGKTGQWKATKHSLV